MPIAAQTSLQSSPDPFNICLPTEFGHAKTERVRLLVTSLLEELGVKCYLGTGAENQLGSGEIPIRFPHAIQTATITTLCDEYIAFAKSYYRDYDGGEAKEAVAIDYALRPLRKLYGINQAAAFGPRFLKAVRDAMIAKGWCRGHVNMQIGRVKRMFKWAVSNEMVPSSVFHALESVDGLRAGRSLAPESKPVRPVPEALVDAILPHVASGVKAMIRLQLLTGMRPGEVTMMRTCDIDRGSDPWLYRPEHHKTAYLGHERVVLLGPKCKEILGPFLNDKNPEAYLFSPRASDRERRRKLHSQRTTPMSCGNKPGSNRTDRPKRKPGARYDTQAYGHAIRYGSKAAFPIPDGLDANQIKEWRLKHFWHPHQLRHNAATKLRKEYGLDVAQVVLGHKTLAVTQVYAEKNIESAAKVMLVAG